MLRSSTVSSIFNVILVGGIFGFSFLTTITVNSRFYGHSLIDFLGEMPANLSRPVAIDGFAAMYRQTTDITCAAAAATYLLAKMGDVAYEEQFLKIVGEPDSVEGYSLLQIKQYFASRGIGSTGYSGDRSDLPEPGDTPVIAHYSRGHYVVLLHVEEDVVIVFDPAIGQVTSLEAANFYDEWSGVFLKIHG